MVEHVGEADIYVLNTCTVTATADSKARQALRAARRANPDAVVVAAGCYPQRAAQELALMPAVSLVVSNEKKNQLVSLAIAAHREKPGTHWEQTDSVAGPNIEESVSGNLPGRSRGMVKIQEGCDQVCAYCIVPKVRGRERSIPPQEIVRQVRLRIDEGCREIALTGSQLGTYGFEIPGTDLKRLIGQILTETDIDRLRVSSLQPQEIDSDLLQLWMDDPRLCPHFHIPLQSGGNQTLKAMRRRYTTRQFADTVSLVRQAIPGVAITADLITGFPGESDKQFEETLAFVETMAFSDIHVFPYSKRPGTSAVYLPGQVSEPTKKERTAHAIEVGRQSFDNFRLKQLGTERPVLWEGMRGSSGGRRLLGLTDNYIRVELLPNEAPNNLHKMGNTMGRAHLKELSGNVVLATPA